MIIQINYGSYYDNFTTFHFAHRQRSTRIDDENKIDAFDLLFQGLLHATLQHDGKMLKILASMDLALVDVIETQFQ